jgi:hypothetical protein
VLTSDQNQKIYPVDKAAENIRAVVRGAVRNRLAQKNPRGVNRAGLGVTFIRTVGA